MALRVLYPAALGKISSSRAVPIRNVARGHDGEQSGPSTY